MLSALKRLTDAAFHRDNHEGDVNRLLMVKYELESAAKHAREIIDKHNSHSLEELISFQLSAELAGSDLARVISSEITPHLINQEWLFAHEILTNYGLCATDDSPELGRIHLLCRLTHITAKTLP